jgi:uncharacterized membrane protein (UPF0127 family)
MVAAFFLAGTLCCSGTTAAADPIITITYPTGARVQAELADTPQKRSRGLMFRERLVPNAGMLFAFQEAGEWSFWMKNTKVALDILWMGPDKRIVYIEENVPICRQDPCPEYKPSKDALYALELPAGSVKREKLTKGMKLTFDLPKQEKRRDSSLF